MSKLKLSDNEKEKRRDERKARIVESEGEILIFTE
jgi:hypothetical protein